MGAAAELQAYIWLYLDQALEFRHGPIANAVFGLLDHEWPEAQPNTDTFRPPVERSAVNSGAGFDYGFDPQVNALWFRRDWPKPPAPSMLNERTITPAQLRNLFDTNREIHRALSAYFEDEHGFVAWHDGRVQPAIRSRTQRLIDQLPVQKAAILACRGAVVLGTSDPLIWIGLTHDLALAREPDGRRRAAAIQARVARAPQPYPTFSWTSVAPGRLTRDALQDSVRAFVHETCAAPEDVAEQELRYTVVSDVAFGDLTGTASFWYVPLPEQKQAAALLARLGEHRVDWIFVCTASTSTDEMLHALAPPSGGTRFRIVDEATVWNWVGPRPWLWTPGQTGIGIARPQDAPKLRRHLFAQDPEVPLDRVEHPALPSSRRRHVMVIGTPGAGKTTALYQLFSRLGSDTLIVVAKHDVQQAVTLALALTADFPSSTVVLVVDDLDRQVAGALDAIAAVPQIRLFTAARSIRTDILARFTDIDVVRLDVVTPAEQRAFLRRVASVAMKAFKVRGGTTAAIEAARVMYGWDASPSPLVEFLRFYRGKRLGPAHYSVLLPHDASSWAEKFTRLGAQDAAILETLSFLHYLRVPAETELVRRYFTQYYGFAAGTFGAALARLGADGWLMTFGDVVIAHGNRVHPHALGLWVEHVQSVAFTDFIEWTAAHRDPIGEAWAAILDASLDLLYRARHFRTTALAAEALSDAWPVCIQAATAAFQALTRLRLNDRAQKYWERMAEDPAPPCPLHDAAASTTSTSSR